MRERSRLIVIHCSASPVPRAGVTGAGSVMGPEWARVVREFGDPLPQGLLLHLLCVLLALVWPGLLVFGWQQLAAPGEASGSQLHGSCRAASRFLPSCSFSLAALALSLLGMLIGWAFHSLGIGLWMSLAGVCVLSLVWVLCRAVGVLSSLLTVRGTQSTSPAAEVPASTSPPGPSPVPTSRHQAVVRPRHPSRPRSPSPGTAAPRPASGGKLRWLLLVAVAIIVIVLSLPGVWSSISSSVESAAVRARAQRQMPLHCTLRPVSWAHPGEDVIPVSFGLSPGADWGDLLHYPATSLLTSFYMHCEPGQLAAASPPDPLLPRLREHFKAVSEVWAEPLPYEHLIGFPAVARLSGAWLAAAGSWLLALPLSTLAWACTLLLSLACLPWLVRTQPCASRLVLQLGAALWAVLRPVCMFCWVLVWPARWVVGFWAGWLRPAAAVVSDILRELISGSLVLAATAWGGYLLLCATVRLTQLLTPAVSVLDVSLCCLSIYLYFFLDLQWEFWQEDQFIRRQERAEAETGCDAYGPRTVRAEYSWHLYRVEGRWRRSARRHVYALRGRRSGAFEAQPLIFSLLHMVVFIITYLVQYAAGVGVASLRWVRRAVLACLVVSPLAAMAAALWVCPGMVCQLGDGSVWDVLSPLLQRGWFALLSVQQCGIGWRALRW